MEKTSVLNESWSHPLSEEFQKDYMQRLREFLRREYDQGKTIFPKKDQYFRALNETSLEDVKVVILGQDPYHGPGQAHGLCFSVEQGVPAPPSLKNIFKELATDVGVELKDSGDLSPWAKQGVLLLNAVLTVEAGKAGAHQGKGWEQFTDRVIEVLNDREQPIVFLLWGSYAHKKGAAIDDSRHLVVKAPHPSPLSAHRGFFGGRYFSRANQFLLENGSRPINWGLS